MITKEQDPYTPPTANLTNLDDDVVQATAIRKEHINRETEIKSVGGIYYLVGILAIPGSLAGMVSMFGEGGRVNTLVFGYMILSLFIGVAVIFIGHGLRALRSWVKVPTGILSAIGLLAFPFGRLINGYILYLIFSKKGKMVFSEEYKEAILKTPDVAYKTSIIVWIFLALLLGFIVLAIISGTPSG